MNPVPYFNKYFSSQKSQIKIKISLHNERGCTAVEHNLLSKDLEEHSHRFPPFTVSLISQEGRKEGRKSSQSNRKDRKKGRATVT